MMIKVALFMMMLLAGGGGGGTTSNVIIVNGEMMTAPITMCTKNEDCFSLSSNNTSNNDYYCAEGYCLQKGSCFIDTDCINPSNSMITLPEPLCLDPTPDPYYTCESISTSGDNNRTELIGVCQQRCRETPCDDGSVPVRCLSDPCLTNNNILCGDVCIPDYCGGCNNTIQFDLAGYLLPSHCTITITQDDVVDDNSIEDEEEEGEGNNNITTPSTLDNTTTTSYCVSSEDCVSMHQYCSYDGMCTNLGSCTVDDDCVMPGNIYPVPLFLCLSPQVDYMSCNDDGRCQKTCAIQEESSSNGRFCQSSDDCITATQYCSTDGTCMDMGSCEIDDDCSMTGNLYPVAAFACEDPFMEAVSCQDDGRCHKICAATRRRRHHRRLLRSVTPQP